MTENRGAELLGVNIAFFLLASCAVLMRCYTRACISKCFGPDDWLMAVACVRTTVARLGRFTRVLTFLTDVLLGLCDLLKHRSRLRDRAAPR